MKCPLFRLRLSKHDSFTLVELLVVIAIIAILAAVTLNVGGAMIKAAKKAKASNTATQIQTACISYYTEYSVYPIPSTATASTDYYLDDSSASDAGWQALMQSLCGMINPYTGQSVTASTSIPSNTRSIAFLNMKASDVDNQGAPLNPLPTVNGTTTNNAYFNIVLDGDYDGIIGDSGSATGKVPQFTTGGITAPTFYTSGGPTGGVGVWANCNASTTMNTINNYVHTF